MKILTKQQLYKANQVNRKVIRIVELLSSRKGREIYFQENMHQSNILDTDGFVAQHEISDEDGLCINITVSAYRNQS